MSNFFRSIVLLMILVHPLFLFSQEKYKFQYQFNPEEIKIIRDSFGVAHIYGKTNADAAYGLAWAHAEDDFATIQEVYAVASKMAGRLKGKEGAKIDYVHQLLRLDELVDAYVSDDLDPEVLRYLEGYCQGLNAYAKAHPKEVLLKKMFPISPKTTLKGYALSMGLMTGLPRVLKKVMAGEYDDQEDGTSYGQGSNSFAFRREMTKEDKTLLVINAHQPIEGMASFYEAHLVSEEGLNIYGGVFPGGASIFHGVRPELGWAHTSNSFDKIDVYHLEMHPKKKHHYKFDREWIPLEVDRAKLKVKLGFLRIGLRKKIYWSKYGATVKTKSGQFYAIRLAANQQFGAAEQWYQMDLATNLQEFQEALNLQQIPMQNITYADAENNIWFINHGLVPKRKAGFNWKEVLLGNSSQTLWTDYYHWKDLPQVFNPKCGFVYNVNHPAFGCTCEEENPLLAESVETAGFKKNDNNRSIRFRELYEAGTKISLEELKAIKYDFKMPKTSLFLNTIYQMMYLDTAKYKDIAPVIMQFRAWDGSMDKESVGAAIFMLACKPIFEANDYSTKPLRQDLCLSEDEAANLLRAAQTYLLKYFGRLDIKFGDILRHQRGEKDYPIGGFPDVMCSMLGKPQKDGRFKAFRGEDLIIFAQWNEQGDIEFSSIKAYGTSSKKDSPHYNDQMELYLAHKTKERTFDNEKIEAAAEEIYHPK